MTKEEIRQYIRTTKRKLNVETMHSAGDNAARALHAFSPYKESKILYCYASYNQELPTNEIIRLALEAGKQVALPKVIGEEITFYVVEALNDLAPGYQGIPEPITVREVRPDSSTPSFMLLPGLAFTRQGKRLGYGGGFYDRYLAKYNTTALSTCGIGYDFQVLASLPTESFDQTIQYLLTPTEMIRCGSLLYR